MITGQEFDRVNTVEVAGEKDFEIDEPARVVAQIDNYSVCVRKKTHRGHGSFFGPVQINETFQFQVTDVTAHYFEFAKVIIGLTLAEYVRWMRRQSRRLDARRRARRSHGTCHNRGTRNLQVKILASGPQLAGQRAREPVRTPALALGAALKCCSHVRSDAFTSFRRNVP